MAAITRTRWRFTKAGTSPDLWDGWYDDILDAAASRPLDVLHGLDADGDAAALWSIPAPLILTHAVWRIAEHMQQFLPAPGLPPTIRRFLRFRRSEDQGAAELEAERIARRSDLTSSQYAAISAVDAAIRREGQLVFTCAHDAADAYVYSMIEKLGNWPTMNANHLFPAREMLLNIRTAALKRSSTLIEWAAIQAHDARKRRARMRARSVSRTRT